MNILLWLPMIDPKPMTLYELLYLIISFLSLFVVAFGFIWVIKSLRTASKQTLFIADSLKANVFHLNDNLMFNIDQLFIDYPDLRKYFYDGELINSSHGDYQRVISIAFYLLDFFSDVLIQKKEYGSEVAMHWWDEWMKDVFAKSPILCQCLIERKNWYQQEIYDFMKNAITEESYKKLVPGLEPIQNEKVNLTNKNRVGAYIHCTGAWPSGRL